MSAAWEDVRITCARIRRDVSPMAAESPCETAASLLAQLQGQFPEGPEAAAEAHRSYRRWLERTSEAVRGGVPPPGLSTPAYRWMLLIKRYQELLAFKKSRGIAQWLVNTVYDIDFSKVNEREIMQSQRLNVEA